MTDLQLGNTEAFLKGNDIKANPIEGKASVVNDSMDYLNSDNQKKKEVVDFQKRRKYV